MTAAPAPGPGDRPNLNRHREVLTAATLALALAFLLQVRPDDRVAFRGLPSYPLPHSCATRAWFGLDCPACGLTRSLIHASRGDWAAANRSHRLGIVMAVFLLVQIPYRLYGLRRRDPAPIGRVAPSLLGYAMIAALIGNWLFNLLRRP
jgi:hypothetical protein